MSGKVLLDTNIIIALFKRDKAVLDHLQETDSAFVPVFAVGELYYGAHKSGQTTENIQRIQEFAAANIVLMCDDATALIYGRVKNELRRQGTPIPENDIWIASIALQHGLTLATRDQHFDAVNGLPTETW